MNEEYTRKKVNPIILSEESTVVSEYIPKDKKETFYQTESKLEETFIKQLKNQAYEYLPIKLEEDLIKNLRNQLERLNKIKFSDTEWKKFFSQVIVGVKSEGILEKTFRIQEDHRQILERDDGDKKNVCLIDKQNIHNNVLQVINQYEASGSKSNRYDVTILVNGLPMVHVELKRRGVDIREAFNQISRYQRESFWSGFGLFNYVQLFVISNGTLTKYYSNTVRANHLEEKQNRGIIKKTSNSFSFTSWWADAGNRPILDLDDFTKTFFAKHTILNILTRYCVFDVDKRLLVMRPYQIAAAEKILMKIMSSINHNLAGKLDAGGYIWHTTGSGKTLTGFKVAQLARGLPNIKKVLFVVDRKDLDYQTMSEYDRFEKGSANSNSSTAVLKKQLEDSNAVIIITTIQKLSRFVVKEKNHPVYNSQVVIIFDECHRSQFGDMHSRIVKAFKKYHLFGFTGTPIFAANAVNPFSKTTEQTFGERIHAYTIVDAIKDKNVLPFRIDYINTIKEGSGIEDKQVVGIDKEKALLDPKRITNIVKYILEHYAQKTKQTKNYKDSVITNVKDVVSGKNSIEKIRATKLKRGFNSLFATASIEAAKRYYREFSSQQKDLPFEQRLKVGIIFSFAPNEADVEGFLSEEEFETKDLDKSSRDFLEQAISDYNSFFNTNYDTSSEKFQNYYKDLSLRIKNRELDIVIVVGMFLTGFDATTLNTLWVDKNLRTHGLIQAFSRTNRILNSVKTYGNIVSFRNLEEETNNAIALFSNKEAKDIVLLKPYKHYYEEYIKKIKKLFEDFPLDLFITGEEAQKDFIKLFSSILRLKNILTSFDDFVENKIISERDFQDYQSIYLDLYNKFKNDNDMEKESINDDIIFEIELIKQVEINVDYILMLIEEYLKKKDFGNDIDIEDIIDRAVNSSPSLRNKKDLIKEFIKSVSTDVVVAEKWKIYLEEKKEIELQRIIKEENLNVDETKIFIENAAEKGFISDAGTEITKILPPFSRFDKENKHALNKERVFNKLKVFYDRFFK